MTISNAGRVGKIDQFVFDHPVVPTIIVERGPPFQYWG